MTARTHNIQDRDTAITITTRPNMIFDEVFQAYMCDEDPPATDAAEMKSAARVVSSGYCNPEQETVPVATPVPVSPCSSQDSESSAAASITGELGDVEDRYLVDPRVLGTGHHGSVRECIDRATGRRCAVKSIRKGDPSVKPGGLIREIMLLREMKHDSVVRLADVFEDAEYVHLVTDLFTGGELFDKIVQKSNEDNGAACFTEDEAARILYQVLGAVSYMHRRGIVHRDIKPENLMFETSDDDSPVKIIDFGLARKHHGRYGEPPMSTVVGTPYYIAPEVLRKQYSKSCDLWSVGVVAYILLCGYPPFNGRNNEETHAAVLRGRYRFPSQEWRGTSPEARDFVRGLLQVDASKRMTVEQALEHPWMRRHVDVDDDEVMMTMSDEENRQVERWSEQEHAVVREARRPMRASVLCGKLARGTRRVSTAFGKRIWLAELQDCES